MKILRITLQNIASLEGMHTVDFTREPLRTAGLFSISGATGAGKSSLLDALCLALFDATPRLINVGRLEDLAKGEKQDDPRTLLRRGTGSGFAEVAFVGIDKKEWTARWSVRRSRKKADQPLQKVDMTLFQGNIVAGGEGQVEEGGTKTAVLAAISQKIGLTFEQFTRAVLLAQNDFATFLKADDKQRAEILQALTGTERFAEISKAIYTRARDEDDAVEKIRIQLSGNLPLSQEERLAAEATAATAAESLSTAEKQLRELESFAAWYQHHTKLASDLEAAENTFCLATEQRASAELRRKELEVTEVVASEARPLRVAQRQAINAAKEATTARDAAIEIQQRQAALLLAAAKNHCDAQAELLQMQTAIKEAQPMLNQARSLDARLEPMQARYAQTESAVKSAREILLRAEERLAEVGSNQKALQTQRDELEQTRISMADYVPYAGDTAKWLDRIDNAIAAAQAVSAAREQMNELISRRNASGNSLETERGKLSALQKKLDEAKKVLQQAETAASKFDSDQIVLNRHRLDENHRVLTRFHSQLTELRDLQDRVQCVDANIANSSTEQNSDLQVLAKLRDVALPATEAAFEAGRIQLELIQAAVSDHAKRLRISLQEGHECPVCGSTQHPYQHHGPDADATAVKAAKKSVKDLEKKRNENQEKLSQLTATVASRSERISEAEAERQKLRSKIEAFVFDSADHAEVLQITALPDETQITAVEERLREVSEAIGTVTLQEKAYRDAQKLLETTRKHFDKVRSQRDELQQSLESLEKDHAILTEKAAHAESGLSKHETQHKATLTLLDELWTGIPDSHDVFENDAENFRSTFSKNTSQCRQMEQTLAELGGKLQAMTATIGPLNEAKQTAQDSLARSEQEYQKAKADLDAHLEQRLRLFEGKSVDSVESEFLERTKSASDRVQELATQKTEIEKKLAADNAGVDSKQAACQTAERVLLDSNTQMESWLSQFAELHARTLSVADLDTILSRDDAWIKSERDALKHLDERVKTEEGKCDAYAKQLLQHQQSKPTLLAEPEVQTSLIEHQAACQQAKTNDDAARATLISDDQRRAQNQQLSAALLQRQERADPWVKLNDLIGSKEGDKFRMIAQRRTLDILLRYANLQLNQLSARYRLQRLPESLNLIVIDCDMGDERRSIHSLSGGESFLVSLALALGLASLASNRVRIESLFIDEGFGSLDPDTLNTAMNALMNLEAQGRKVGVISHVAEMTDAIPVQVKVLKGKNGASKVVVPGFTDQQ